MSLHTGDTLLGRYVVEELVGTGSSSEVYRVHDKASGAVYALKHPTADVSAFLEREVMFWLGLPGHRNVVTLVSVEFDESDRPVVLTEYATRGTLRQRLTGQPWTVEEAWPLLRDIARGMEIANRANEVAHLDLKPENILFGEDGMAKIGDFGLARGLRRTAKGFASVAPTTGTIGYQAPEIVLANGRPTQRSDIYSFGLLALELLTGDLPFARASAHENFYRSTRLGALPEELTYGEHKLADLVSDERVWTLVSGCLQVDPSQRSPTFQRLLTLLDRLDVRGGTEPEAEAPDFKPGEVARRSLSQARIRLRQGDEEAALRAVNKAVLYSQTDHLTRADALDVGADILEECGRGGDGVLLRRFRAVPGAAPELSLETLPSGPRQLISMSGHGRKSPGIDPWSLEENFVGDEDERDRWITAVQRYQRAGRFRSSLDLIREILPRNPVLGLRLATIVLGAAREDVLLSAEPPTDLDYHDPRFDTIAKECGSCGTQGWARIGGVGRTLPGTNQVAGGVVDSTVFLQCTGCDMTVCGRCRHLLLPDSSHPASFPPCPHCGGQIRSAAATGRRRPWQHFLLETPVAALVVMRAGVVPLIDDAWLDSVLTAVSPDLVLDRTVPRIHGPLTEGVGSHELALRAEEFVAQLVNEGRLDPEAQSRIEYVHGTDADGVPFALAKVLEPAADALNAVTVDPRSDSRRVGVLFEIGDLARRDYTLRAFRALLLLLDQAKLIGCTLYCGNVAPAIPGTTRYFCMVIEAPDPDIITYIRQAVGRRHIDFMPPGESRFTDELMRTVEPMEYVGFVNSEREFVVPPDGILARWPDGGTLWDVALGAPHH
ncbi:serine/threonine-protein kinase [Streptomyces sp. NPDC091215]|uniref:serine/threonine-protein kinase n=1 Tax=Streptomyces sp. NPDC091215 TaxID=3155192 RepID=UPI003419444F